MFYYITLIAIFIEFCLKIAWQQHDVQELCRVMFDALEQKWKQTEQVSHLSQWRRVLSNKSFITLKWLLFSWSVLNLGH